MIPSKLSPEQQLKKKKRSGKYKAVKVEYQGIKFDSTLECNCYKALQRMQAKGLIAAIALQFPVALLSNAGVKIGDAVIDFLVQLSDGRNVLVEAKGIETAVWRWKKKHVIADSELPLVMITRRNLRDVEDEVLSLGKKTTTKRKRTTKRKTA